MHDAERADEHAEADAAPEAEQRDHDAEVENRFGKEQETVQQCRGSILFAKIALGLRSSSTSVLPGND